MGIFKRSNNNTSKTVRTQTVIMNGRVVSGNDPEVKAMMDNMQRKFGGIFGEGNVINANSDPDDIDNYVENRLRQAGISNTADVPESEYSFSSSAAPSSESQPRVFECKNCGAKNTVIPGANAVCEYCGSGLE